MSLNLGTFIIGFSFVWPAALAVSLMWGRGMEEAHCRLRRACLNAASASVGVAFVPASFGLLDGYIIQQRFGVTIPFEPQWLLNAFAGLGALGWMKTREKVLFVREPHRCTVCDYDLRGLAEDATVCPECGTTIAKR